jgi:hypothetical protein
MEGKKSAAGSARPAGSEIPPRFPLTAQEALEAFSIARRAS